jgi:transcription initiation factor IIF auxiliary subunit
LLALWLGVFLSTNLAAAQKQEITTANTSRQVKGGQWEWTVFIKASPEVLKSIRCVEYKLPSTVAQSSVRVCSMGDQNQAFAFKSSGWRTFDIAVKITFKNGRVQILRHKLSFEGSTSD